MTTQRDPSEVAAAKACRRELETFAITGENADDFARRASHVDWPAEYESTRVDDEPTDESAELGGMLEALYWWASHYHMGQESDGYRLLSAVSRVFTPGQDSTGPELETTARDYYAMLCEASEAAGGGDGT